MKKVIVASIAFLSLVISPASAISAPPDLCTIHYSSNDLINWECYKLTQGDTPKKIFGDFWQEGLRFNRIDQRHFLVGMSLKVPLNPEKLADFTPMPATYTEAEIEPKFILLDLAEQYLGAYEYGNLSFSLPVATGKHGHRTPSGEFKIDAYHREHSSSLYNIKDTDIPYPMFYALRFYIDSKYVSYWLHGRDMPGVPVSHGCIGLSNEQMQKHFYNEPRKPAMEDARKLYEWTICPRTDDGLFHRLKDRPRLLIINEPPA